VKFLLIFVGCAVFVYLAMSVPRLYKNIRRKLETVNTYAIQNLQTGKDIRVHNAGIDDGRQIILYSHHNWECMTWQFIQLEGDLYLLKNLYTHKTFQPSATPEAGITLYQQPLGGSSLQYWEFLKQDDGTYLIRLKDTGLYITAPNDENNAPAILMPLQDSPAQRWKLIEQHPIV
jgi:hypothetical protein